MANHVVIMAGGIGSRFWPLSTPEYPKQFIDILDVGRTLIQQTVDRFAGLVPDSNFWVVANKKYVSIVREQLLIFQQRTSLQNLQLVIRHLASHGHVG